MRLRTRIFLTAALATGCNATPTSVLELDLAAPGSPVDMAAKPDLEPTCPTGTNMKLCGGLCTDLTSDAKSCGACGMLCPQGESCVASQCVLVCPGGLTVCGAGGDGGGAQSCVNLLSDDANCGACQKACPMGNVCSAGKCTVTCQQGLTNCTGSCVNLKSDLMNCGACGTACPGGNVCAAGACMVSCPNGQLACNGACVNPDTDSNNCGQCGTVCPMGQSCVNRACMLNCPMGTMACNNTCANRQSETPNCGQCGTLCPMGTQCAAGVCAITCQPGQVNCNGQCTNLQTDAGNCGKCGMACPMGNLCMAGQCALSCPQGLTVCNNTCANLSTDSANCGKCGVACAKGAVCSMGVCGNVCNAPLVSCNSACVDPRFDPNNCNGCGMVCGQVANASPGCFGGACGIGACSPGYRDCDGNVGNGCEIQVSADPVNCGVCGKVCGTIANGTPGCAKGVCGIATCNQGFGDCNNNPADGCEVNLNTDVANCGSCANACGNGQNCTNGKCVNPNSCVNNNQWTKVTCQIGSWVWSSNRNVATNLQAANAAHVLQTGCHHAEDAALQMANDWKCSLSGTGWVSTTTFVMANCDAFWYHIGGRFTGDCGGHNGDVTRHLALGDNDCYAY